MINHNPAKKHFRFLRLNALLILLAIVVLSSCVPQKKILYLQDKAEEDTASVFSSVPPDDRIIQPGDNLYIQIFSLDQKTFDFFNKGGAGSSGNYYNEAGIYMNSYSVNDSGYIEFPIAGKILVENITIKEAKNRIESAIKEYLKEVTIVVKLVSFNITILGEVNHPGQFLIYKEKLNIFEAFSLAGDLTDFANRNRVMIIRQTKNGSAIHRLDLTSKNILSSKYFYVMPKDIIYIQPLGIKQWGFQTFPYAIVFSAITTTLLLINYFR